MSNVWNSNLLWTSITTSGATTGTTIVPTVGWLPEGAPVGTPPRKHRPKTQVEQMRADVEEFCNAGRVAA